MRRSAGRSLRRASGWGGVGGTRQGIKCLHAHYANYLSGGDDFVGRWAAERIEPVHESNGPVGVAAIDQGTNSTRLLVLEPRRPADEDPRELARDMRITRLGEGVDATGRLDPERDRADVGVVARFAGARGRCRRERIRVGATSAVRDAANREGLRSEVVGVIRQRARR